MLALVLIVLHTVDGRDIDVNPAQITSMRSSPDRALSGEVRCMISLADGKFVAVIEECEAVRKMVDGK